MQSTNQCILQRGQLLLQQNISQLFTGPPSDEIHGEIIRLLLVVVLDPLHEELVDDEWIVEQLSNTRLNYTEKPSQIFAHTPSDRSTGLGYRRPSLPDRSFGRNCGNVIPVLFRFSFKWSGKQSFSANWSSILSTFSILQNRMIARISNLLDLCFLQRRLSAINNRRSTNFPNPYFDSDSRKLWSSWSENSIIWLPIYRPGLTSGMLFVNRNCVSGIIASMHS